LHIFDTECCQIFNQNLILDKWNPSKQITQQLHFYFIYFINNVMQQQPLCEKVIAPGCATFSCNDSKQTLSVVVYHVVHLSLEHSSKSLDDHPGAFCQTSVNFLELCPIMPGENQTLHSTVRTLYQDSSMAVVV
jgi:hypothetical protein